jgi:hypothetical protein
MLELRFNGWNDLLKIYYNLLDINHHILHSDYTIEALDTTIEQNRVVNSPADQVLFRIRSKQINNNGYEIINIKVSSYINII